MATQILFSDLMAAAAVVAASSTSVSSVSCSTGQISSATSSQLNPITTCSTAINGAGSNCPAGDSAAMNHPNFYSSASPAPQKNYLLEDQRALQLAFELSMLNGGAETNGNPGGGGGSNSSSLSSSSSLGHHSHEQNMYYLNAGNPMNGASSTMTVDSHEYDNVLQHFLVNGNGANENTLNNLPPQHHQVNYDEIVLEKYLIQNQHSNDLNQAQTDFYQRNANSNGGHSLNNLINGISSINLNNLQSGSFNSAGNNLGGLLNNETERFKKSQNMTECVPVPSSEHVAEIVGRQGCKIKALRAKTNTYIKTPVRGEEPVFVVTGRKEDVAKAKKEILSAAEHFSLIRASRKPSLTTSNAANPGSLSASPLLVNGFSGHGGIGDIFSSSSSRDNSPSILTKNPIGLTTNAGHNQITVQVRVPYRVVGLVVGPKGATIKNIQQQTHTYIVTPSRDKEPIFEVTGAVENVEIARQQIEAHIAMRTGGTAEGNENLSGYLNSINGGRGADLNGLKKGMISGGDDDLQLLNENFNQSTNFLRKYLNGQDDQAQMDLFMSNLYANGGANGSGLDSANSHLGLGGDQNGGGNAIDLFANRMRIDDLLHNLQQKQQGADLKRDNENLLLGRNLFSDLKQPQPKQQDFFGSSAAILGGGGNQFGGAGGVEEAMTMRRQLLSNNSEDDEGVGLELQETSPPSNSLMKMILDGSEENNKYLWSTLNSTTTTSAKQGNGEIRNGSNQSSDSSCLSSASPSPTLNKFFTFQNGQNAAKARNSQEGDLSTPIM